MTLTDLSTYRLILKCIESSIHLDHVKTCKDWAERLLDESKLTLVQFNVIIEIAKLKEERLEEERLKRKGDLPHLMKTDSRLREGAEYKERLSRLRIIKQT